MAIDVKNSNYVVRDGATLEEAMTAITANERGAVIVVDEGWRVIGVLADGDIRRAMLKGAIMQTPASKAATVNVVSVSRDDKETREHPESFFEKNPGINVVPVTETDNTLIDVIVRGGGAE